MVKTFEIDLDDALVENASEIFEALGTDIDSAIKIFLTQATLRHGFPFEVVIPNEEPSAETEEKESAKAENIPVTETVSAKAEESSSIHAGVSEEEENALATVATSAPVGDSPAAENAISPEIEARVAANEALVAQMREEIGDKNIVPEFDENEDDGTEKNAPLPEESAEDDEDETTPDNLFDAWDVGEEEDIGCR